MRKIFAVIIFILALLISGCDSSSTNSISQNREYENCIPPQNPYNDGGGHDAGFNWAMEGGTECDGKSYSFNEGCFEYFRQLKRYNECISRR